VHLIEESGHVAGINAVVRIAEPSDRQFGGEFDGISIDFARGCYGLERFADSSEAG